MGKAAVDAALARSPEEGRALAQLGLIAERRGERALAAERYQQAIAARDPAAHAIWRLAALRIEDGRIREASDLLGGLPEADLRGPEARVRLAVAIQTSLHRAPPGSRWRADAERLARRFREVLDAG